LQFGGETNNAAGQSMTYAGGGNGAGGSPPPPPPPPPARGTGLLPPPPPPPLLLPMAPPPTVAAPSVADEYDPLSPPQQPQQPLPPQLSDDGEAGVAAAGVATAAPDGSAADSSADGGYYYAAATAAPPEPAPASSSSAASAVQHGGAAPALLPVTAIPGVCGEEGHSYLADVLRVIKAVHAEFYAQLDERAAAAAATTAAAADGAAASSAPPRSPPPPPRTDAILARYCAAVLDGCCLLFSGVFPLKTAPERTPLWRRALAFGARVADTVNASAPSTALVRSVDEEVVAAAVAGSDSNGAVTHAPGRSAQWERLRAEAAGGRAVPTAGDPAVAPAPLPAADGDGAPSSSALAVTAPGPHAVVTHVVARLAGTAKVTEAKRVGHGGPAIVGLGWLEESLKR
jgi:hypothetical protein